MKIALDRIDTRGVTLDLGGIGGDLVAIASTTNLRGTLESEGDRLSIPGAKAERLVLASLRLLLGTLSLNAASGATLDGVTATIDRRGDALLLDVTATSLEAYELAIVDGGVAIHGRARLLGPHLDVRGEEGSLSAERVEIEAFSLRIDDLVVRAESLRGAAVKIRWGGPNGFAFGAGTLSAPELQVEQGDVRVVATGVALHGLGLQGDDISLGHARLERAQVALDLQPAQGGEERPPEPKGEADAATPLFDWRVLDGLSGRIDVDVAVDLTVPILGRRQATHELRVPIERGSIDYRELERNLSALEDAILDFAVRENALVIERVNPLLPLRGHGKPVIAWAIDGADLALAEQNRVRLAVLPQATVVGADEPSDEPPGKSAIALRLLRLLDLRADLALAPVDGATLGVLRPKQIAGITLEGSVQYDPGAAAPPGQVKGSLQAFAASIHGLPAGATSALDVEDLTIVAVPSLEIAFADVSPTTIRVELTEAVIEGLRLAAR